MPYIWDLPTIHFDYSLCDILKDSISPIIQKMKFSELQNTIYLNHTELYTDGSKKGEKTGFAVVKNTSTSKERLYDDTTVFTAELMAIKTAIHCVLVTNKKTICYIFRFQIIIRSHTKLSISTSNSSGYL